MELNKCLPIICSNDRTRGFSRNRRRSTRRSWNGRQGSRRADRRDSWHGHRIRGIFRQRRERSFSDPITSFRRAPRSGFSTVASPLLTSLVEQQADEQFPSTAVTNALKLADHGKLSPMELEQIVMGDVLWCSDEIVKPFAARDPILFEPLKKKAEERFLFIRNKSLVFFNVDSLVKYLVTTGDFRDPESRIPFSDSDLRRLDRQRIALHISLPLNIITLLSLKNNQKYFEDIRFREQTLHDLSELCGDVVSNLINVADSQQIPQDQKVVKLSYLFSEYTFNWNQYVEAEKLYVKLVDLPHLQFKHTQQSLQHFMNRVVPESKYIHVIKKKNVVVCVKPISKIEASRLNPADVICRTVRVNASRKLVYSFLDKLKLSIMPQQVEIEMPSPTAQQTSLIETQSGGFEHHVI